MVFFQDFVPRKDQRLPDNASYYLPLTLEKPSVEKGVTAHMVTSGALTAGDEVQACAQGGGTVLWPEAQLSGPLGTPVRVGDLDLTPLPGVPLADTSRSNCGSLRSDSQAEMQVPSKPTVFKEEFLKDRFLNQKLHLI